MQGLPSAHSLLAEAGQTPAASHWDSWPHDLHVLHVSQVSKRQALGNSPFIYIIAAAGAFGEEVGCSRHMARGVVRYECPFDGPHLPHLTVTAPSPPLIPTVQSPFLRNPKAPRDTTASV